MFYKFSPSQVAFYREDIYEGDLPSDVVEVSEAEHADLMQWQSEGKIIVAGPDGRPRVTNPPKASEKELEAIARQKRNRLLTASDWTQLADVSEATRKLWANYRQTLRDITSRASFPLAVEWPKAPDELS